MPSTAGATVIDPVCGMSVDPEHCAGSVEHEGQSYYFCSRHCVQKFQADPQRYVTLARFFAENISVQAPAFEKTVMDSAEAVNGADAVLLG